MTYVRLDDGFFRHPKVVSAGRDARFLYLAGLCYCGANLTDGLIPAGALRVLAAEVEIRNPAAAAKQLIAAGLWEACEDGFQVHDYLDYNRSSEKVRADKEAAAARMQRNRSGNVRANTPRTTPDVRETFGQQDTDTDTEADTEGANAPPEGSPPAADAAAQAQGEEPPTPEEPKPKPEKRKRRIDENFVPSVALNEWAASDLGLDAATIRRETEKFTDHFRSKGEARLDWPASWRNWMRRVAEGTYAPVRPGQSGHSSPAPASPWPTDRELTADEMDAEAKRWLTGAKP